MGGPDLENPLAADRPAQWTLVWIYRGFFWKATPMLQLEDWKSSNKRQVETRHRLPISIDEGFMVILKKGCYVNKLLDWQIVKLREVRKWWLWKISNWMFYHSVRNWHEFMKYTWPSCMTTLLPFYFPKLGHFVVSLHFETRELNSAIVRPFELREEYYVHAFYLCVFFGGSREGWHADWHHHHYLSLFHYLCLIFS